MDSSRMLEQVNQFSRNLPHKVLSKYVTLGLVVYLAYYIATLVWQVVPVQNSVGKVVAAGVKSQYTQRESSVDLNPLVSLELFGVEGKVNKPKPTPQLNQSAPKTRLNVTLTGLVADSGDPVSATSVAIIESRDGQNTYGINDKISGTSATIFQILVDRVILSVSGRFETLMLDGIKYSTTPPTYQSKAKAATVTPKKLAQQKREKLDKRKDMELAKSLRQQRAELFKDPTRLDQVIRIRPYRQNGELKGYRLSPGKDAKLFKQVGLQRNDLAISINGNDLTNAQQAFTVMTELKSMTEATITVVRQGELIDIILAL